MVQVCGKILPCKLLEELREVCLRKLEAGGGVFQRHRRIAELLLYQGKHFLLQPVLLIAAPVLINPANLGDEAQHFIPQSLWGQIGIKLEDTLLKIGEQ